MGIFQLEADLTSMELQSLRTRMFARSSLECPDYVVVFPDNGVGSEVPEQGIFCSNADLSLVQIIQRFVRMNV